MVDLSRTALMSEIGGAGLKRSSGYVQEEFLRELSGAAGMRRYREMRDNDPCVGAMLYLITRLLQRLTWEIHPADETSSDDQAAAEFIAESFDRMNLPWSDVFAEAAQQFVFGWALAELVYARDGKGIIWDTWAFRAQESLSEWVFDPETDRAMAMVQRLWTDHNPRTIPLAKCIHFRMSKSKGNPESIAGIRNAYRPWYYSTRLQEIESIGAERDLVGVPVAHIPLRFMSADATAADKAFYERIKTLVRNIRRDQHEGLVLPSDLYPDTNQPMVSFSLLSTGGTRQFDLNTVITRYEQRILMTALADFIMLGHEKVGSFALSSDKTDMFIVALSGMVGQMAKDIESQAFDRLLALNGMIGRCKLTHSDFEKPNLIEIADFVAKLTGVGALTPGELDLENTLRALADLPPIDEQMHSKLQEDSTSDEPTDRNNRQPPDE